MDICDVIDVFTMLNLNLVDVLPKHIPMLKEVHRKSLLSNDAFHLLTMEHLSIKDIVTNDGDFEKVAGIKVWKTETL